MNDTPPPVNPPGRRDGRVVIREWTDRGVRVRTVHPASGVVSRGELRIVPGGWEWVGVTLRRGFVGGDYLDAELVMLDRTNTLD